MEGYSVFRIIFFLGAVNALFFSILVFSKKEKTLADKILAWWLIVLSLQVIYPFLYMTDMDKYQMFMGYEASLSVFHPAGLFFYTKAMVGKLKLDKTNFTILILLVLSMALVFIFVSYLPENRLSLIENHDFFDVMDLKSKIISLIMGILYLALFAYFLIKSNNMLKEYKEKVMDIYSNSEKIDLQWLRRLILFFYACYALTVLASIVIFIFKFSMAYSDYFYYFMIVVFVFLIGYWGHQQGSVFNLENKADTMSFNDFNEKDTNNQTNNTKEYKKDALALKKLMEEEHPYLEPTLTIHDLASKINLPAHQLSKVIHKEFGKSFYEYINYYRIESFKKQVISEQYQNFTLLAIAFDCGFNSKSAFNRIFKEQTGLTPRDFKLQASNKKKQIA